MKIIIDAYQYAPAITGTDRMAYSFLTELQKLDKENLYYILCSREQYTRCAIINRNFKVIKPPIFVSTPLIGRYVAYIWRRLNKIFLMSLKADTYYTFHNMTLPGRKIAKRMIASNLDLIPIILEEYESIGRASTAQVKDEYTRVVDLADQLISISEYSKQELSKTLNVPKSKIEVIHLAADVSMSQQNRKVLGKEYPQRYFFTLGGSEPRKNVQTVIDAYSLLPDTIQNEYKLLIAGGDWHGRKLNGIDGKNVIRLGYVEDSVLPQLYANAVAFIFASKYEGFGFTILEAMACGAPVVSARGSSLDEVAGKATLTFDPTQPKQLRDQMVKLLSDPMLSKVLVKKGFEQNKKFSWYKAGRKLHAVLTSQ
jgi:glycosyltransferase involved in cell wall biosynthesis